MQSNSQNAIDVLNSLVEINNYRVEGYDYASKETEGSTMKSLFSRLADTSRMCRQELSTEIKKLGGVPKEGTAADGRIFSVWMEVKMALNNKNRKAVLNSCEMGEYIYVKAYEEVLVKVENVDTVPHHIIEKQYTLIKADHERIRNLRRALLEFR